MKMCIAFAKYRGTEMPWQMVTNYGEKFIAQEGLIDLMIEKMEAKYPSIEYKKEAVN